MNLRKQVKPKNTEKKQQKEDVLENLYNIFEDIKRVLNAFDSKIFPIKIEGTGFPDKVSDHSNLKILTPKEMLQRLLIALAQIKADNTSGNFLKEIRQMIYSLLRAKEITKKEIQQYQILAFTIHGKIIKKSYKNNKFKISAPTWNEEFELPDGSYSISGIQDYFEYIFKTHW